jgi:hypothetical protein
MKVLEDRLDVVRKDLTLSVLRKDLTLSVLWKFKSGAGKGQGSCGTTGTQTLDETPQSERQRYRRRPIPECQTVWALWVI